VIKAVVILSLPEPQHNIFFFFFCEGAPQLMLRTHRSLKAYCATPVMKMSSFWPSFTSNGAPVEWNWQGKTDNSEKNLSQCHFVHHKSHLDLTWDRTRASMVRGRRLTAWAMARPWWTSSWNETHLKCLSLPKSVCILLKINLRKHNILFFGGGGGGGHQPFLNFLIKHFF
jgi:hypothetical protein